MTKLLLVLHSCKNSERRFFFFQPTLVWSSSWVEEIGQRALLSICCHVFPSLPSKNPCKLELPVLLERRMFSSFLSLLPQLTPQSLCQLLHQSLLRSFHLVLLLPLPTPPKLPPQLPLSFQRYKSHKKKKETVEYFEQMEQTLFPQASEIECLLLFETSVDWLLKCFRFSFLIVFFLLLWGV